jgi:2-dehydro-3-deoxyphosphogluconate aldolase/(4S)-4-hydroxy-2-oxoglutarate aldolase
MMAANPIEQIEAIGVVPVIAIEEAGHAVALADALAEGGLPIAEITFRTRAAAEVLATLREKRPDFLAGAGTVLDFESVKASKENGAKFALSPGFDPEITAAAHAIGLPFMPGVMTPSDLSLAVRAGFRLCKFFPDLREGRFAEITAKAKAAVERAKAIRESAS